MTEDKPAEKRRKVVVTVEVDGHAVTVDQDRIVAWPGANLPPLDHDIRSLAEDAIRLFAERDKRAYNLVVAWQQAVLKMDTDPDAEQTAYDALVDFVESTGLNHSIYDPREYRTGEVAG